MTELSNKGNVSISNKEQQFKQRNALLEQKTASLISEAEAVFKVHEALFADISINDVSKNSENVNKDVKENIPTNQTCIKSGATKNQKLSLNAQKKPAKKLNQRTLSNISAIEERALFADHINNIEISNDSYTPSAEDVIPIISEIGSDASMRYLKAKLRVMQEEYQKLEIQCQEKENIIFQLNNVIKEKEESENLQIKKNSILQSGIEKSKKLQEELSTKNCDLESQLINFKKEIDSLAREKKNALSTISSLEVRLNRALEDAEKYKNALQKSKENLKVANDTDKKQFEFLKNENIRLEKQKCELMTAFKKQLKLIDILKRQKMHIEAAKLLEFTEEEFMRTLDWNT
ncbi:testis-expressed protein 9 isoform X1 [Hydra vulgaris]|uniref:testis-expressed protein 9 isoform X1 n=1 Tax=Hydra vulgaris TaxID=6087 RepID=UPI001F5F583D|nr:testis-expressed protein 9 isoform X1 [Hydra vulgaris]